MVTDSTLPSESWVSAVDVDTWSYPPSLRRKLDATKPSSTTTAIQNHTDRKSFFLSIHRCRATGGRPDCPSTLLIVAGRRARLRGAPRRGATSLRRRYTGDPVPPLVARCRSAGEWLRRAGQVRAQPE